MLRAVLNHAVVLRNSAVAHVAAGSAAVLNESGEASLPAETKLLSLALIYTAFHCGALVCVGAGGIAPQPDPETVADFLNQA